jgi:hypothetical protein
MFVRQLLLIIASGSLLCSGLLSTIQAADFSHVAYVPAGVNASTIQFEKARLVLIPAATRTTSDAHYCAETAAREPGGSWFCPSIRYDSRVPAWEITYSYEDLASTWVESAQTRSSFQVLYRPSEISSQVQKALSAGKQNRSEIAEYFTVKANRESVPQEVIDEAHSSFCDGGFVEGAWVRNDSHCTDHIALKTVAAPSGWITVRVEPVPAVPLASLKAGS